MKRITSTILIFTVILINICLPIKATSATSERDYKLEFDSIVEYFDSRIESTIEIGEVPGAALAIVKDGKIFTKGYGYSDLEKKIRANEDTSFKIASITKLFTAISTMQLVERGMLDLEVDIREYISNYNYSDQYKINTKNLLTHTSGFDESMINYQSKGYKSNISLESFIKRNQPLVLREPGTFTQYSNYGYTLAGYVIEKISGVEYKDFVNENTFKLLQMSNTSFNYESIETDKIAKEYIYKENYFEEIKPYSLDAYPAGAINSSSIDMAKFMKSLIYKEEKLLQKDSYKELFTTQFSNHKDISGICYGFLENTKNGNRFIGHGGSLMGVNSELILDLDNNLGIYVVANSNNSSMITIDLIESFTDNFYHYKYHLNDENKVYDDNIIGEYYSNRFSRNTIEKIQLLLMPSVEVEIVDTSKIKLSGIGPTKEYVHIGDNVFVNQKTGRKIAFGLINGKNNLYPFLPEWTLTKFTITENPAIHLALILISVLVFIFNLIVFIFNYFKKSKTSKIFKVIIGISFINLLFIGLFIYLLSTMATITEIGFGISFGIKTILILPIISLVLSVFLIVSLFKMLLQNKSYTKYKWIHLANSFFIIMFLAILNYYNLIGFNY